MDYDDNSVVYTIHLQAINNLSVYTHQAFEVVYTIHLQAINNSHKTFLQLFVPFICKQSTTHGSFMKVVGVFVLFICKQSTTNRAGAVKSLFIPFICKQSTTTIHMDRKLHIFFTGNSGSRNGRQSSRDVEFHLPHPFLFEFLGGCHPDVADQFVL